MHTAFANVRSGLFVESGEMYTFPKVFLYQGLIGFDLPSSAVSINTSLSSRDLCKGNKCSCNKTATSFMSLNIVEVFLASLLKACEGGGMAIVAPSLALANSQSASIACHLYAVLMGRRHRRDVDPRS